MTPLSFFQELDDLEITIRNGNRRVVVGRIVFGICFFLRDPHTLETRRRIVSATEHLLALIPLHQYKWWLLHGEGRESSLHTTQPPKPQEILRLSESVDRPFALKLWDSQPADAAAPRQYLNFFCRGGSPADRNVAPFGSIQIYFPLPWVEKQGAGAVPELFIQLAETLQPFHGTGGLVLSSPITRGWQQLAGDALYPLLHRFPGLETGYAWEMDQALAERMGPVNWLTAVHNDLLLLCGGAQSLRNKSRKHAFPIHDYGEGLVIQAGSAPQLGDRDTPTGIHSYETVATLLRNARVEYSGRMINKSVRYPGSEFSIDELAKGQIEYLTRFDTSPSLV